MISPSNKTLTQKIFMTEEKKKNKRPTAQKRDIRNEKRRVINKSFKSEVRTTMRTFEGAWKNQDKEKTEEILKMVYRMVDKCVKRGIYKPNKAARIKATAYAQCAALAS
ncbi:MAG: 30S ribosomal protein S20 [Chlamydiae bacterium]|nr:30S ribosomal protein S20 [Chlamydiota bacterium]